MIRGIYQMVLIGGRKEVRIPACFLNIQYETEHNYWWAVIEYEITQIRRKLKTSKIVKQKLFVHRISLAFLSFIPFDDSRNAPL